MPNVPIEVTPELVRTVDAMSWKGYGKLLGLMIIPLVLYHILFHTDTVSDQDLAAHGGQVEERLDALASQVTRLDQTVQDLAPPQ